jgi:hypothetical protein
MTPQQMAVAASLHQQPRNGQVRQYDCFNKMVQIMKMGCKSFVIACKGGKLNIILD